MVTCSNFIKAVRCLPGASHLGWRPCCHAGGDGCLRYGRGNPVAQALVEWRWDQLRWCQRTDGVAWQWFLGQRGDGAHASELHFFIDGGGAHVERTTEDVREAQHVVDLVRVVRAARGNDGVAAHGVDFFWRDFRVWIGQREDQWTFRHRLDHLCADHAAFGHADEDVGANHGVCQVAVAGVIGVACLVFFHIGVAAWVDHALAVAHFQQGFVQAQRDQQVQAGDRRCTGAGDGYFDFIDILAYQFQAVQDAGRDDDGRAMLVVVEDRNVHALAQLLLDVEAVWRLDVFQVDAAEGRLHAHYGIDEQVGIVFSQFDVEYIDVGELLEQASLAFHHRFAGQRADIAQAQYGGAIGDHGHQVAARSVGAGAAWIFDDRFAGKGYAWRIGQGQGAGVAQRFGGGDGNLAGARFSVIGQGGFFQVERFVVGVLAVRGRHKNSGIGRYGLSGKSGPCYASACTLSRLYLCQSCEKRFD